MTSARIFQPMLLALAVTSLMPWDTAYAADRNNDNTCFWGSDNGRIRYEPDVGALYVARDARVGDVIGPGPRSFTLGGNGSSVWCRLTDPQNYRLTLDVAASVPPVPVSPWRNVLTTNIPGVGALITFGGNYDGSHPQLWRLNTRDSTVPFDAYIDWFLPTSLQHSVLRGTVTLIKTGPIDPGRHMLDSGREMLSVSFTNVPNAMGLYLAGSVTQAECSLSANPVSADPVELGDWPHSHFTGEDQTTDPVSFTIALNSCMSDPLPGGTVTHANIRLDPTAGSRTLDAAQGIFSLGNGSTAQGVGIQILGPDALTPVALGSEVVQGAIPPSGGMLLEFNARYYQTAPTRDIRAGSAGGALGFTITYK